MTEACFSKAVAGALAAALLAAGASVAVARPTSMPGAAVSSKNRLFVLTDIEADPDDTQSLIRLLLYSNEIDVEGLAAVTSGPQPDRLFPQSIHAIIDQYAKVRPNLLRHAPGYPTASRLHASVSEGSPQFGRKGVGPGRDSGASRALIRALERRDPRPLWVNAWGGTNVLAQALFTIKASKSPEQAEALYRKLRVYTISDQDDSGPWIRQTFPSVFYIVSPGSWFRATWMGMTKRMPHSDLEVISDTWIASHIQQRHGPLGAVYPDVAYGLEGDTPAFLGLIPNGLNDLERPNWGSWGGRYELYTPTAPAESGAGFGRPPAETRPIWTNAEDHYAPPPTELPPPSLPGPPAPEEPAFEVKDNYVTLWRWRTAFQNDFAARMDWTTKTYAEANHPPIVRLNTPSNLIVRSGDQFDLDASGSADPDGDSLSYFWFQYREAGSYPLEIKLGAQSKLKTIRGLRAPSVTKPETIHFIAAVSDKGSPALTRYARVVVTVLPREGS